VAPAASTRLPHDFFDPQRILRNECEQALVTVGFNVPRNERLAHLEPGSPQAAEYWLVYLREWSFWNHVRSAASLASAACAAGALVI
jgi:uncharacterized membrane protein